MSTAPNTEDWTVARLLQWTRGYFEKQRVESPRLCAEILLAHAMKCERIELYTRYELVPAEDVLTPFRESVKQAASGRPIAYLTGIKEFFSLPFEVTPDVLIPRPETEVLVERVVHMVRRGGVAAGTILDLCTGSGNIAVSLAKNLPDVALFASDLSEAALAVAKRNAEKHAVGERIEFRYGDLFMPWKGQMFDVIICNPPYIGLSEKPDLPANVRDHEPAIALFGGQDGYELLRRLAAEAPAHLSPAGHFLTEIAYSQGAKTRELFADAGWRDIQTYRDGLGEERAIHARWRSGEGVS